MNPIRMPEPSVFALPNGMKVYLLEDHGVPTISGLARIRTGSLLEPEDKAGLATLGGAILRSGGSKNKPGELFGDELDAMASTLDARIDRDSASVSFSALKENAAATLSLVKDLLAAPEFSEDALEQAKAEFRNAIAHRNDDARRIAAREFSAMLYGKSSPYGRREEYSTVDRITRGDLLAFHRRYFVPKNVLLAVWGDFDAAAMKTSIEKLFADWTAEGTEAPAFPKLDDSPRAAVYQATKRDAGRTYLTFGRLCGRVDDSDGAELDVLSRLLPSGIRRRVAQNTGAAIAAEMDISAEWRPQFNYPGVFTISVSAKSAFVGNALQAIRDELARFRTAELSDAELKPSESASLASLAFSVGSTREAMSRLMDFEYFGYPKDFLQTRQQAVLAVSPPSVLRVANARLDPSAFLLLVAGEPASLTAPGAPPAERPQELDLANLPLLSAPSDSASQAKGAAMLARARQAIEGSIKLEAIQDFTQTSAINAVNSDQSIREVQQWLAPAVYRTDQSRGDRAVITYLNGRGGWTASGGSTDALGGVRLQQINGDAFRLIFRLLTSDHAEDRTVTAISTDMVEIVGRAGDKAQVAFDEDTSMPLRVRYISPQPATPSDSAEETWSDFRDAGGIKLPYKIVMTGNGRKLADVTVSEYKINAGLKLEDLQKHP